ncbi:MAG TPA: hypothetical protein VF761_08230 [Gemmatimonadaceae bacterium]
MLRRIASAPLVLALAALTAACSSERVASPNGNLQSCGATAVLGELDAMTAAQLPLAESGPTPARAAAMAALSIAPLNGAVVGFPAPSAQLSDTNGRYLVVPQYAVQGTVPDSTPFTLAVGSGAAAVATPYSEPTLTISAQGALDARLRRLESRLPLTSRLESNGGAARVAGAATAPDSVRKFYVLGSLEGNCFVQTEARLRYSGARVYIYEDTGVRDNLSAAEYADFGKLFDEVLYPIDTAAFGSPSDVDGNGHIIVLLSQRINKLTASADCRTKGYVAGYFFGYDLTNGSGSNRSEVFYSIAPDSAGQFSCAHPRSQVKRGTPPTFIHEFQHMISYNQHVLLRGGQGEVTWLNEGLSHIAEELGSKYYEAKYPAPSGRSDPAQLFPDSSQGFIVPDFQNAYNYLHASTKHSVTTFAGMGTLEERGAAWLFLRWLGDQKGEQIYKQLVQTNRRGIDNVSAAAGEPFPALFGDFGIATYADSIDGVPRTAVPQRYRFTSRDTRKIFARVCGAATFPNQSCPAPITPVALGCTSSSTRNMVQGTSAYYIVGGSTGCSSTRLEMTASGGTALPSTLQPQIAIFRLP